MISISKVSSAGQASAYFEKADYYTQGENGVDISSSWFGEGTKDLGGDKQVDPDVFKNLLQGISPTGQQIGTVRDGKLEHVPAWDLTLSAPKSVSILALVGGDERLLLAHKAAVDKAMSILEADYLKGRQNRTDGMKEVPLKGMIAAQFTHTTSRKLDPQLHTHNVLMNMGVMDNGKGKSLDSTKFYNASMLLGLSYRSELANKCQELGYDVKWDEKKGLFEIDGVEQSVIDNFSKRRKDVLEQAEKMGAKTAKDLDKATVKSRDTKKNVPTKDVIERWNNEAKDIQFNPSEMIDKAIEKSNKSSMNKDPSTDVNQTSKPEKKHKTIFSESEKTNNSRFKNASGAINYAIKVLNQREAAFKQDDVVKLAISVSKGAFKVDDFREALHVEYESGRLLNSHRVDGLITTKEEVRRENYILDLLKHSKDEFKPVGDIAGVKSYAKDRTLRPDQEKALYQLATSKDGVNGLQGWAGVGKTYMLKSFIDMAEKNGYVVEGYAATGEAAKVLEKDTGLKSDTLASLLIANSREKNVQKPVGNSSKIWVIDEASLVNSKNMADLLTDARKRGVRVVLSGDYKQLGSVDAGKPYHQMIDKGMNVGEVDNIVRQKGNVRNAIYDIINSDVKSAFQKLDKHFVQEENRGVLLSKLVDSYLDLSPEKQKETLMIVPDNETRKEISESIRDTLAERGEISKHDKSLELYSPTNLEDEKKKYAFNYEVGMSVRFHREFKTLGVEQDSYYKVVRVEGDRVFLSNGSQHVTWEPNKVAGGSKNGVTAYYTSQTNVSEGDRITWKDKNSEQNLKNGNKGVVIRIEGESATFKMADGSIKTLDMTDHRNKHFEHAYASTVYAAQGHTYQNSMVLAESWRKNLVNQTSFYVAASRSKDGLTFFTDNKELLQKGIEKRLGTNTSGLDVINDKQKEEINKEKNENVFSLTKILGVPENLKGKDNDSNKKKEDSVNSVFTEKFNDKPLKNENNSPEKTMQVEHSKPSILP